jgi:hypothetical protein
MKQNNPASAIALLACILLAGSALGHTQSAPADSPKPAGREASKKDEGKKPALAEATRVSTDEAARSVAKEKAKQGNPKAEDEKTSDAGVTEFRPTPPSSQGAVEDHSRAGSEKKPQGRALKNVHGTVHGATGSSATGSRAGAAVGASSSRGKTSIYVETERDRENPPRR